MAAVQHCSQELCGQKIIPGWTVTSSVIGFAQSGKKDLVARWHASWLMLVLDSFQGHCTDGCECSPRWRHRRCYKTWLHDQCTNHWTCASISLSRFTCSGYIPNERLATFSPHTDGTCAKVRYCTAVCLDRGCMGAVPADIVCKNFKKCFIRKYGTEDNCARQQQWSLGWQ